MVSPECRLQAVHDAVEGLARVGMKCFTHFAPSEPFEGSFTQFMRFIEQVSVVANWWSRSSAHQGAALALALAKSYHTELDFNVVTQGYPADPITGAAMPDEVAKELVISASAYAGRVESNVITNNFMPTTVPNEDSQKPPEYIDYDSEQPFRASLNGTLTTYPPPKLLMTDAETGTLVDLDRELGP